MTEQLKAAGLTLSTFFEKNAAAVVSIIFALGFVWAQFEGLRSQLVETKSELRRLTTDFQDVRLLTTADRRDTERLLGEVAFHRERIIALRLTLQEVEGALGRQGEAGR